MSVDVRQSELSVRFAHSALQSFDTNASILACEQAETLPRASRTLDPVRLTNTRRSSRNGDRADESGHVEKLYGATVCWVLGLR